MDSNMSIEILTGWQYVIVSSDISKLKKQIWCDYCRFYPHFFDNHSSTLFQNAYAILKYWADTPWC